MKMKANAHHTHLIAFSIEICDLSEQIEYLGCAGAETELLLPDIVTDGALCRIV